MLSDPAHAVFAGCGTAIFFSSTRVSTFATETETGPGQLGASLTANQSLADLEPMVRKGEHGLHGCAHAAGAGWLVQQPPRHCNCTRTCFPLHMLQPHPSPPTPCCSPGFIDTAAILTVNSSWGVLTAMAFGFGIMVLAYGIGERVGSPACAARLTSCRCCAS